MSNAPIPPPLPPEPQSLNYGDPRRAGPGPRGGGVGGAPIDRRQSIFSLIRFVAAIAVMSVLMMIFLLVIPRLERVYADFGTKLPWITQLVLDVSRFLQTPLGWVVAAFIAGVVALVVGVLPIPRRWLRLLVVLFLAAIVIALGMAVLLPILNMMESLTSNPGKL